MGTVKFSLTCLRASDSNSFWDAFNGEIIVMASFVPTCFSSTIWVKVFSWVSNLNSCRSLAKKTKTFAEVHDQNLHHATLLKAVLAFSEEFQCGLFAEIYYEYSSQLFQLLGKKMEVVFFNFRQKFYRSFLPHNDSKLLFF